MPSQPIIIENCCGTTGGGTTTAGISISLSQAQLVSPPYTPIMVLSSYNNTTSITTYTRLDTGTTITQGDFEPIKDLELLEVELVDDVAGDGTGLIIPYSELYTVDADGTRSLIAVVDNKGADYNLLGTRRSASEIGTPAKTISQTFVVSGANWSPTSSMTSFQIVPISISGASTYTDSVGSTVPLFEGVIFGVNQIEGTTQIDTSLIELVIAFGDTVFINTTSIGF